MSTPAPHETPDSGWMGNPARGASMGRPSHGPAADIEGLEFWASKNRKSAMSCREEMLKYDIDSHEARTFHALGLKYDYEAAALETQAREARAAIAAPIKFNLQRVRLDSGGYDSGGAYWGHGAPLWAAWSDATSDYFRAQDREGAKAAVRAKYPAAMFFR